MERPLPAFQVIGKLIIKEKNGALLNRSLKVYRVIDEFVQEEYARNWVLNDKMFTRFSWYVLFGVGGVVFVLSQFLGKRKLPH